MTIPEAQSEKIWFQNLRIKNLEKKVRGFESGEKYLRMKEEFSRTLVQANRDVEKWRKETEAARRETARVKHIWMDMYETLEKELTAKITSLEEENERQKKKLREKTLECYQLKTELAEEKEKNRKLTAMLNKDFENSSIPSSAGIKKKKIPNSREKSDKKRGAQPGHPHHPRKRQEPTRTVEIRPDEKFLDEKLYRATGEKISRQMVGIHVQLDVTEYVTEVFIEKATGHRVHADFPEGVKDDVNYDGSVKAFLHILNSVLNASIAGSSSFLSQLTNGQLKISAGMINGLNKEFAEKTKDEQDKCFRELLTSPTMHVDFTNAVVNGESRQVLICSTGGHVSYFAKEHKGHKGVADTPVRLYDGILIHDHDVTWYSYGSAHQECLAHILRALKGSIENEPNLKWNVQMRSLLQEMIHVRNSVPEGEMPDGSVIKELEERYDKVLETGREEYEYEPPSDYYRDGYNLWNRLREYRDAHLLFLHDMRVESDNNEAERYARSFKRKQKQMMAFRSDDNFIAYCDGKGVVMAMQERGDNIYLEVAKIFESGQMTRQV